LTLAACSVGTACGQTPLSRYNFDGNLENASNFVDTQGRPAPDGTFREGTNSATAPEGVATYGFGVDGKAHGALVLDGVDDWVDVGLAGHPGAPIPAGTFSGPGLITGTAMAWVRVEPSLLTEASWLMGVTNVGTEPMPNFQSWQMGWNGTQLMARPASAGDDSQRYVILDPTSNTAWADGDWHHIAFTWDGVIEEASVYVDGAPLGQVDGDPGLTLGVQQKVWDFPMAIGAWNNQGALEGFWGGLVDDLRVYAAPLSDAQIETIFESVTVINDPDADFNADGDVDGADFLTWQRGRGGAGGFAAGDASMNGAINNDDFAIWAALYGQVDAPTVAATAPVPEPGARALAVIVLAASAWRRRAIRMCPATVSPAYHLWAN
jgi:hypothetical protein